MYLEQLSVFMENKVSRLNEVLLQLKTSKVNVLSLSLADTSEFGVLRLIVDNPEEGRKVLKENGFSARLTKVLAIKLPNEVGTLQGVLEVLGKAGMNVEYMYVLANAKEFSGMIIKTGNPEEAAKVLADAGIEFVKAEEVGKIGA
ncbi:MAG: amino acid-binding protein [Lachnospiraceae bacterium]|nr:amino acid-binding protein [Lachnospiraceae bacterium]MBQ8547734.1 amino acid-binding protein [Lachnospiraceae bacterium]MBQ8846941.1 amino acid-binding protein [Lachnospiraceae bacterium]